VQQMTAVRQLTTRFSLLFLLASLEARRSATRELPDPLGVPWHCGGGAIVPLGRYKGES
jgi:hypothetical protein